ncbi:MAG: hypothetical protein M1823_008118, partial [Watsoniomyces obsoletus]
MPLCSSANVGVSYHPQRLHPFPDWVSSVTESPSWNPKAVPSSHVITAGGAELVVDALVVDALVVDELVVGALVVDELLVDALVVDGLVVDGLV